MIRSITIGRTGGQSSNGETILYDKNNGNVLQIPVAWYPLGTKLRLCDDGSWKIAKLETNDDYTKKIAEQSEMFYYATKDWLPYRSYLRARSVFPDTCYDKFVENPFYLLDIKFEGGTPISIFPIIDSHIVLPTFASRMREIKRAFVYILERNEDNGHTLMKYINFERNVKKLLYRDGHPLLTGSVSAYLSYYADTCLV